MIHLLLLALSVCGFWMLLLAKPRHQQDWLAKRLSAPLSRGLLFAGGAALVIAFAIASEILGWSCGVVVWSGWLTVAAMLVIIAHTNRSRILRWMRR